MQSMLPPKAKCEVDPGAYRFWSRVYINGISQCLKRDKNAETCPNNLVEEDGHLVCQLAFVTAVALMCAHFCGRRGRYT